jgi:hypothetical protein
MKRQLLVAILLTLVVSPNGFGQTPQAGGQPTRMISGSAGNDLRRTQFSRLSLEEQAKLRSAHDTAMRDPALVQSRARYEQARKRNFAISYATRCLRPIHPFNRFSKKREVSDTATGSSCRLVKTNWRPLFQHGPTSSRRSRWQNRCCKHCRICHVGRKLRRPRHNWD